MSEQLTIEDQLSNALNKFKSRVDGTAFVLWYNVFKNKFVDLKAACKAKDNAIYGELMQIESIVKECEPSEQSAKILTKIYKLKGIISAACLCLLCLNIMQFSFNGVRSCARNNQVWIVKIMRRREEMYA